MQRLVWAVVLAGLFVASVLSADVVVFVDGSRLEVLSFQIKGGLVLFTTPDGKLRSVPRTYVDLGSTDRANRGAAMPAPRQTTRPPSPDQPPLPERPPVSEPAPAGTSPDPERPLQKPTQPSTVVTPPAVDAAHIPPPVWSSDELKVSLVVPSAAWRMQSNSAPFDVAVRLDHRQTGAKATLGIIRQRMRSYKDFQKVVRDVDSSIAAAPSYQSLGSGPLRLEPYTAHEHRYLKGVEGVSSYNRMVIYYSRDLAYVLSLSCPWGSEEQNEVDFDAFVKGLVIKKVRKDITPKGAPKS